nr:hypothetical protein [Tanacetum cinerariifolium]
MYGNFSAPSTESLNSIFNWLQKIVSQLAILGDNISQEYLNIKFLRSLPAEWNTHVVVWKNKPDIEIMSFDDLYNNFKIIEQEVKRRGVSSSTLESPNMAFLSSPSSTNEVNTASIQVSATSTPVSTVNSPNNTANLSDATVYAFLSNQPNGSHLVHEDLEQIHEDDLEEIGLKWQLALLSMRAKRGLASVEEQFIFYKKNEVAFCDQITVLKRDASFRESDIIALNLQLEKLKKEKESNQIKIDNFKNASKSLDKLIRSQITDNGKSVTSVVGKQGSNAVKSLACWVWRPKIKVQDHVSKNSGSYICKRFDYVDPEGRLNGCSRHMTRNKSFLSDYQEYDRGFVAFAGSSKGGFLAQSVGSSNADVLELPCLLVLITGTSQSRQHSKSESDNYNLSD